MNGFIKCNGCGDMIEVDRPGRFSMAVVYCPACVRDRSSRFVVDDEADAVSESLKPKLPRKEKRA